MKNVAAILSRHRATLVPRELAVQRGKDSSLSGNDNVEGGGVEEGEDGQGLIDMDMEDEEDEEQEASVIAPKMIPTTKVFATAARIEAAQRVHNLQVCLSSDFTVTIITEIAANSQRFLGIGGRRKFGSSKFGQGRGVIENNLQVFGVSNFKISPQRLVSTLFKYAGPISGSMLFTATVDTTHLELASDTYLGSIRLSFNDNKIESMGLAKFSALVLEFIRKLMSDASLLKKPLRKGEQGRPKTVKEILNEEQERKTKAGFGLQGNLALFNAVRYTNKGRGVEGSMASKEVIDNVAKCGVLIVKYLAAGVESRTALAIVKSAILLAEKDTVVLCAALKRTQDSLKAMSMQANRGEMFVLFGQFKRVIDLSIPSLESLVHFLYQGLAYDVERQKRVEDGFEAPVDAEGKLTLAERRHMLFANGLLAQFLQGYLQISVSFFFGGERDQVYKMMNLMSLNVSTEVDLAKLGTLIVSAVVRLNGVLHLSAVMDKMFRWANALLVPVPKPLMLALTLMYAYRAYIVFDRAVAFGSVPKGLMTKSAIVAETTKKLAEAESWEAAAEAGDAGFVGGDGGLASPY